jgi:hypothetical protein
MFSVYRCLLRLYPADYRDEYGDEMAAVFLEAQVETRAEGLLPRGAFYLREVAGLLRGALREDTRAITGFHRGTPFSSFSSFPQRRFAMPSEFRFPK